MEKTRTLREFDYRTSMELGKQTLGGHKLILVHTKSQEKGAVSPQETESDLPMSVQESLVGGWVDTLTSGQTTGMEQSPAHQQKNCTKDLLSMTPPIGTGPSFPLSQSLPSGSFHKPLILLHQRAERLKTTITEN